MDTSRRPKPLTRTLREIDEARSPVTGLATDYPVNWHIEPHVHTRHQLIYAVRGVMVVQAEAGRWVVPPTRAIWMLAGMTHEIRCIGEVHMRSLQVTTDAAPKLLGETQAVGISPLLRELIHAAMEIQQPYVSGTRNARVMRLILDELRALPVLPLHLHMPSDARLLRICEFLQQQLDDSSTMADWARRLTVDVKTIQRLFVKETGMTFGQWRQQARLLRALELLATGEKVIDVALALGYESPSAFANMFRKQFGQTPSQFFVEG
ncbi:HTH-type transcriptional regulator NimR [Paraburkholderia sediminicola]|uniref:HTH-type transcriptional regulator NimR n=1 Tax=Paraburkholderia sediminicola TaxID=458836 RepID=A0A6J5CVF0_9BURK|nr:helix-turn-helix transcriptional regulator [Paraburkholderia sediminicola]CAB3744555.1 HTH-type transcriptional regulator NimR [Paraburkholderia sediminicola]